jgi:hypothetical protein
MFLRPPLVRTMNRATEYLLDDQECHATRDRIEPDLMRCNFCRLAWDRSEEPPPRCRARASPTEPATPGDYRKLKFSDDLY